MFKSASKIVLLLFAVAYVVGLFIGTIPFDGFSNIGIMVFSYYFMKRTDKVDGGIN